MYKMTENNVGRGHIVVQEIRRGHDRVIDK